MLFYFFPKRAAHTTRFIVLFFNKIFRTTHIYSLLRFRCCSDENNQYVDLSLWANILLCVLVVNDRCLSLSAIRGCERSALHSFARVREIRSLFSARHCERSALDYEARDCDAYALWFVRRYEFWKVDFSIPRIFANITWEQLLESWDFFFPSILLTRFINQFRAATYFIDVPAPLPHRCDAFLFFFFVGNSSLDLLPTKKTLLLLRAPWVRSPRDTITFTAPPSG